MTSFWAWIMLLSAGVFEIGWPLGFKLFGKQGHLVFLALAVISMAVSGFLLYFAQRQIPMGTAYAVWTGIGAIGTFLLGVWFFGDLLTPVRCLGILLILGGVITLKLGGNEHEPSNGVSMESVREVDSTHQTRA